MGGCNWRTITIVANAVESKGHSVPFKKCAGGTNERSQLTNRQQPRAVILLVIADYCPFLPQESSDISDVTAISPFLATSLA